MQNKHPVQKEFDQINGDSIYSGARLDSRDKNSIVFFSLFVFSRIDFRKNHKSNTRVKEELNELKMQDAKLQKLSRC